MKVFHRNWRCEWVPLSLAEAVEVYFAGDDPRAKFLGKLTERLYERKLLSVEDIRGLLGSEFKIDEGHDLDNP